MLHRFFTGLHRRCSLFARDFHFLFVNRKLSVANCYALIFAIAIVAGCSKPSAPTSESDSKAADTSTNILQAVSEPLLKFHWIGKKRLATEANATNFMAIWNLPESARLEAQTLDKLATAPWRLWQTNVALSNAPSNLLRTLLDDLVQEEVYVEATGGSNQISELVIALRLPDDRAALWETNLPIVLNSLSKLNLALDRSSQSAAAAPNWQLSLTRTGHWTFVSVARPVTDSLLVQTFASRIAANGAPYAPRATNYWVEAQFQAYGIGKAFDLGWSLPATFPFLTFEIVGDGENVRSHALLTFSEDIEVTEGKWNIPTNIITDPLASLTAARKLGSYTPHLGLTDFQTLEAWSQEFYSWSLPSIPTLIYFAVFTTNATSKLNQLTQKALAVGNQWLETNSIGAIAQTSDKGLAWKGFPFGSPFLKAMSNHSGDFIVGGLMPMGGTNRQMSQTIVEDVFGRPNLIYYDWELSKNRVNSLFYLSQLARVIFQKAQMPRNSAGLIWLNSISARLTTSATLVTVKSSRSLEFIRRSTIGLTALELHLAIDWLESPSFPCGLHTFEVQPEQRLLRHREKAAGAVR